jgi:tetratricopeptide (TPR) repeat protein
LNKKVTWDTSYYNLDGSVNETNLVDSTENVFIPQINLTATYHGVVVGIGGTVKVYQLNKSHPVEYVHMYLNGTREADGGLMFMFNDLTTSGILDKLLTGILFGGGSTGSNPASALLSGLSLTLTAFAGSAPLTLSLDSSFFTGGSSPYLTIPASSANTPTIKPSSGTPLPFIHYDHELNLEDWGSSMSRFTEQLGLTGDITKILGPVFGFGNETSQGVLVGKIITGVSMILTPEMLGSQPGITPIAYNFSHFTSDGWYIEPGKTIYNGLAYNNATRDNATLDYSPFTSMFDKLSRDLTVFRNAYDVEHQFDPNNSTYTWYKLDPDYSDSLIPKSPYTKARLDNDMGLAINNTILANASAGATMQAKWLAQFVNNASSWYNHLFIDAKVLEKIYAETPFIPSLGAKYFQAWDNPLGSGLNIRYINLDNSKMGKFPLTVAADPLVNLFEFFHFNNETLADVFHALGRTIPQVMTGLLFSDVNETTHIGSITRNYGLEDVPDPSQCYNAYFGGVVVAGPTSVNPSFGVLDALSLLLVVVIASFLVAFVLLLIIKGTVKINRREFLGREDVQKNINAFIKQVEQLGGKVSVQNAEALVIRAFRSSGKIEKPVDVEKRAKIYVENQKLLVTLQSRASRAYVAQKFKDCIAAIEKMIDIARKLEDQTLVANYEDNLAKVVKLLRRKGISVNTKVRVEEGAQAGAEVEKLSVYKNDLIELQNKASKLFAERNWAEAKNCIKEMLAIAKKIQDPVLIRNYEANLRKIISMEKGGSA